MVAVFFDSSDECCDRSGVPALEVKKSAAMMTLMRLLWRIRFSVSSFFAMGLGFRH